MVRIDADLLMRFTGQTTVDDPAYADSLVRGAAGRLRAVRARHRRAVAEMYRRAYRAWLARTRVEPWVWSLAAAAVVGFASALACFAAVGNRPLVVMPAMLGGFAAGGAAGYLLTRDRPGETPENRRAVREAALQAARAEVDRVAPELAEAARNLERWRRIADGIRRALEFPVMRLLNADPALMDGTQFELYLADIFRLHGYHVEPLGGSGDQGVDLILTLAGVRTAVQAKCYSGPVGNAPVQEVFAGRVIHGCHRWAVVTSSTFTSGGRQAAAATGTILVDGSQLHALIRGQIRL